jgi:hypothetical protein
MKLYHLQENRWTQRSHVRGNKPESERQLLHVCSYMQKLSHESSRGNFEKRKETSGRRKGDKRPQWGV